MHGHLAFAVLRTLEEAPTSLAYSFHGSGGRLETVKAAEMRRRIAGFARALPRAGLPPRSVIPIVAENSAALWACFVGAMGADIIPCVLPVPTFKTHLPTYARNLRALMGRYGASRIVVGEACRQPLSSVLGEGPEGLSLLSLEALDEPAPAAALTPGSAESVIAFLQHSSGSTGIPRGVALSHAAVLSQLAAYAAAIRLDPSRDRVCSWLPLYHDMGLVTSFLLPLVNGVPCDSILPQDWILDPMTVIQLVHERRSTLAWWPNFAFSLLAKRARSSRPGGWDLRCLRMIVNCSEPVLPRSHESFLQAFASYGLDGAALQTCYALAENVFAATQSGPDPPPVLTVERDSLRFGQEIEVCTAGQPEARRVMSSGRLIPTVGLRVTDGERRPCEEGRVGEVAIAGPSLFRGYYLMPEPMDPAATGGWHYTGDIGFLRGGELFVLGRASDLIVVGGRKFYPNDLEHLAGEVEGVKEGRVVAFGILREEKGTEDVVVLVESVDHEDRGRVQRIKREIKARAAQRLDCPVDEVQVLPPQSLIKTSSGKIARRDNRELFVESRRPKA